MNLLGLVDANHFYVACERVFQPTLLARPVAVLSNNDGCVIARSPEIKALGVPMGAPYFEVRGLLARHRAVVCSSNYALYADMSARLMQVLELHVPAVEVYSIDEAFVHLDGIAEPLALAETLAATVQRWTGLPVCVGLGPTKVLAKLANRLAKRAGRPGVCCLLDTPERQQAALAETAIEDLWGIGRRWGTQLHALGLDSALALREADAALLRRRFGVVLERIVWELRGRRCLSLSDAAAPAQQIIRSRSFGEAQHSCTALAAHISQHTARAAEKLRATGQLAGALCVFIRTSPWRDGPQYANSATRTLPAPSADTLTLLGHALRLLRGLYRPGYAYTKVGVMLLDLVEPEQISASLLPADTPDAPRRAALMQTLDAVNRRFGPGTLRPARSLHLPGAMRRGRCSPAYTTRWDELPLVR